MNQAEERFKALFKRRFVIVRPSWPDFLCREKHTGDIFGVEVKSLTDDLSENQIETFDWLERHDVLNVKVWHRAFPGRLWHWEQARGLKDWIGKLRRQTDDDSYPGNAPRADWP